MKIERTKSGMGKVRIILSVVLSITILCALAVAQQSVKYGMDLVNELRQNAAIGAFGAASNLGFIYAKGLPGVPKDNIQAYMWWDIATDFTVTHSADMNKTSHSKELARLRELGQTIGKDMTPAQISEAKQRAAQWKSVNPAFSSINKVVQGPNPITPPKPLFTPLASYPEDARRALVEGVIYLNCTIQKDGHVGDCKVTKGLGHGLDEASLRIVETQWRFEPAILKGEKIDMPSARIEMPYKLTK